MGSENIIVGLVDHRRILIMRACTVGAGPAPGRRPTISGTKRVDGHSEFDAFVRSEV